MTMEVGRLSVSETLFKCGRCHTQRGSEELAHLVPRRSRYSYGVMVHVGRALFQQAKSERAVQQELREHNIEIARSEIGYLGKKFIAYLALAHQESAEAIKEFLTRQGGYILHLDGTCEGESPFLMSGLDSISGIVLRTIKIPSEKAEQISVLLKEINASMGSPLAVVSDMSTGIESAVRETLPGVPHFFCHFHFLRDIGKDLLGADYDSLRRSLKNQGLKKKLRVLAKKCKTNIDTDQTMKAALKRYILEHAAGKPVETLPAEVLAYTLALWILNAKLAAKGHGFPFDRPHLTLYERLVAVADLFAKKKTLHTKHSFLADLKDIAQRVLHDCSLERAVERLQERAEVFDRLRNAMRIATPDSNKALNDNGDAVSLRTIKEALTAFRSDKEIIERAARERAYQKMLKQLDRSWEKLFADPIIVQTSCGKRIIQPQRTNNDLERFFRALKRTFRRKSGCHSLTKTFYAILADTPLVRNLDNKEYMTLLLNGKVSLEQRFADIDAEKIRRYFTDLRADDAPFRLPAGMKKVLRLPNLPLQLVVKPHFRLAA